MLSTRWPADWYDSPRRRRIARLACHARRTELAAQRAHDSTRATFYSRMLAELRRLYQIGEGTDVERAQLVLPL